MQVEANAKVNLDLRVGRLVTSGLHEVRSLMLSITWADLIAMTPASEDEFIVSGPSPAGDENLAVRARDALRAGCPTAGPIRLELTKRIPVAAGLGGGSADAAAVLWAAARLWTCDPELADRVAPSLGSDVPFCLVGGMAVVGGTGDLVEPLPAVPSDFVLAIVVPPVEVSTAAVYAAWDRLGGPEGQRIERGLPPSLRAYAPLRNDLEPAAAAVAPSTAEWKAELRRVWQRPVLQSGSGPSLFAFFMDDDEAEHALAAVPIGARHTGVAAPAQEGVVGAGGTLP